MKPWIITDVPEIEKTKCAIELSPSINQIMICEVWSYVVSEGSEAAHEKRYMMTRLHHMIHGLMIFGTISQESEEYRELEWLRELVSGGYLR